EENVLGEVVYDDADNGAVPHGALVSEDVAPTMLTEDAMDQSEVTRSIEDEYGDITRMARAYESMPVKSVRLSTLRKWYRDGEDTLAMRTLLSKTRIVIDKEYLVNPHDPDISWVTSGNYLDYRQIVSRANAVDVLLPN
ncbi:hypothetical protein OH77DRAFT_1383898, partial [Trametes cingulata]